MTKHILTAAIVVGLALPSIAVAQTAQAEVTFACRPVAAGETATTAIQNTPVLCHALDMERIHHAMTAAMADMSPEQKAKLQFAMQVLRDELSIHAHYPGFDGNPND